MLRGSDFVQLLFKGHDYLRPMTIQEQHLFKEVRYIVPFSISFKHSTIILQNEDGTLRELILGWILVQSLRLSTYEHELQKWAVNRLSLFITNQFCA